MSGSGGRNGGSDTGGIAAPCEKERAGSAQNLVIVHALEGINGFIVVEFVGNTCPRHEDKLLHLFGYSEPTGYVVAAGQVPQAWIEAFSGAEAPMEKNADFLLNRKGLGNTRRLPHVEARE